MKVGVGGLIIFMEKLDRRLARHVHPNVSISVSSTQALPFWVK